MDIKVLTEDEVKSLEYIEKQLNTAMMANYAIGITSVELDLCANILEKYIGRVHRNYNCNSCKLKILQNTASFYFKSKKYYDEKNKVEDKPKKTTKKKGGKNEQV